MGPYDPTETLSRLIKKLEKGEEFPCAGGKTIYNKLVVSKRITLLSQKPTLNKDIREWGRQTTDLKTWAGFKTFFSHAY